MMLNDDGTQAADFHCWQAFGGAAFAGVFVTVLLYLGGNPLTYDEPWYLESVGLLHEHGWSANFLRSLPGPAGPLYTVVHFVFEPVTRLAPPLVRWVNPLLLFVAILATAGMVRSASVKNIGMVAATFFAIPMTWACAGMALTEIPAACAYALHLFCLTRSLRGGSRHFGWAVLAAAALGAGILGRQPLLLTVMPLAYLGTQYPQRRPDLVLVFMGTMAVVLPVFAVWGGLVPPQTAYVGGGVSLRHLFLAGAYGAICGAIVCPDLLSKRCGLLVGCLGCGLIAGFTGWTGAWLPMDTLLHRLIPHALMPMVRSVISGFVAALGIWFFASCAISLVKRRGDPLHTFIVLSLVLQIAAAMAVKHQFSSRYVLTAVPLFAWLSVNETQRRSATWMLGIGAVIGCASLVNYLILAIRPDM